MTFRVSTALVITLIFMGALASAAGKAKAAPSISMVGRCFYTPQADQQSTSLPTFPIGLVFAKESLNNNEIAVDLYKLDASNNSIKLIGHGELVSTSENGTVQVLDVAADSPFDFKFTFAQDVAKMTSGSEVTGTVDIATTFQAEAYASLPVACKLGKPQ